MSKIKNGGLDQYGPEPFEQQQLRTAGVEGVNNSNLLSPAPEVMGLSVNNKKEHYLLSGMNGSRGWFTARVAAYRFSHRDGRYTCF